MRHALVVVLFAAVSLSACDKVAATGDQIGLANWEKAPPLTAGVDEGAEVVVAGGPGGPGGRAGGFGGGGAPVPIVAAAPGTVPVRKAGLWQTTVNNGRGPQAGQLCVDEQSELRRGVFSQTGGGGGGRGGQGCEPKIAKSGANWTYSMSCTRQMGEASMKVSSSQTLSGDLNAKYQVKGTSTTSGGPNPEMNGNRAISASGSFVGACPAGMKAGDFKGADGQVRNIMQQGGGGNRGGGGFGGPGGPGGGRREGGGGEGGGRREGGGGRPQGQAPGA